MSSPEKSAVSASAVDSPAARIRREFSTEIHRLPRLTSGPLRVFAEFLGYVGQAVLAAVVIEQSLKVSLGLAVGCYPIALFFIGTRFRAIGNMIHEACHGNLLEGKRRNRAFGHFFAIVDFVVLDHYTQEHFSHHRHLGHPTRDLDFVSRQKFGFGVQSQRFLGKHILGALTLRHLPAFLRPVFFSAQDPVPVKIGRLVFLLALGGVAWFVGLRCFALYYLLPYLVAYQVIRYWSDAVDHAEIISEADEFSRSRNHIFSSWLLNRVVFPRNDEYHLTHHLFPALPTRTAPLAHALLLANAEYRRRNMGMRQFAASRVS